jgi:hypothetical protein
MAPKNQTFFSIRTFCSIKPNVKWPTTSGYVYHEVHISRLYHVGKSSGFWIELKIVEATCAYRFHLS